MGNPLYGQNKADRSLSEVLYRNNGGATHTNSTDDADLFQYTIPANKLAVGDIVRIKVYATVTDNNSTDTLTPVLKFGGTAIATGAALDVADDDVVYAKADVFVTAIGSSGTMTACGEISTNTGDISVKDTTLLTSKDTTAAAGLAIVINMDWSAAHAENIVRLDGVVIEIL